MELVDGASLGHEVEAGGTAVERVIELGLALTDALAAAHEKRGRAPGPQAGERDAHPRWPGEGARLRARRRPPRATTPTTRQTPRPWPTPLSSAGQVMGTVPYMAPEQVRGEAVDQRTDLFALGILLYELATGQRPFPGDTPGVISSAILRDAPVPLTRARIDAPADLERIISRCLEKDPRRRFQTALDVGDDLRRVRTRARSTDAIRVDTAGRRPPPLLGREERSRASQPTPARGRARAHGQRLRRHGQDALLASSSSAASAPDYAGGAAFVSLASVTDAAEVLPTVATALDIAEAHGRSALEALCTVIGDRPVLLVLDNLEQVLDAAEDIAALRRALPPLQVVATSRAPLKIGAESEFALPPLELPERDDRSARGPAGVPLGRALRPARREGQSPDSRCTNSQRRGDARDLPAARRPAARARTRRGAHAHPRSRQPAAATRPRARPPDLAATATYPCASAPCARRSAGATRCSTRPSNNCCAAARCSTKAGPSRRWSRSAMARTTAGARSTSSSRSWKRGSCASSVPASATRCSRPSARSRPSSCTPAARSETMRRRSRRLLRGLGGRAMSEGFIGDGPGRGHASGPRRQRQQAGRASTG